MSRLRLSVLGGWSATLQPGSALELPSQKTQALLAYLTLHPGQPQTRVKLMTLLWPDHDGRLAGQSLRRALYLIRRALGDPAAAILKSDGDAVLVCQEMVEVDAAQFEQLVKGERLEDLELAATLYRGELLEGLDIAAPTFEEWLRAERERLYELAIESMGKLLAGQLAAGSVEPAIRTALQLLNLDPLQEAVHRALMRLYVRQGRRTAALKQYQVCVDVLARDLGIEPEPQTRTLCQEIVRAQSLPSTASAELTAAVRRRGVRSRRSSSDKPLVDRREELARLRSALDDAVAGAGGRFALIVGEAGIGKSRLVEALADEAVARGGCTVVGRAYESEQALPFQPWIDALRSKTVLADTDAVDRLKPGLRAELSRLFPELGEASAPSPPSTDNATRLFEAVLELVNQIAGRQLLVIIIEDLHWADEMSLRLLAFLARRATSRGVLLAATAREEEMVSAPALRMLIEELTPAPYALTLKLTPLSRDKTIALVRALARSGGEKAWLTRIEEQVWALSEGNPFVVVECMRARPDHPSRSAAVMLPARVREVITARLERLGDRAGQLAAVAAVIGREFSFALAQRAAGLEATEAAVGMEELVRRRVLDAVGEHFAFAHDRIRQVAYDNLLEPRRQALHATIGGALEVLHSEAPEMVSDQLAYHYSQAGMADKAITYLTSLAEAAGRRYALTDAVRWLEQALAFVDRLAAAERDARRLPLLFAKASALSNLGRFRDIVTLLIPQRQCVEALAEARPASQFFFRLGLTYAYLGRRREAEEVGTRALQEARRTGDPVLMSQAHHVLSLNAYYAGEPKLGVEHAAEGIRLLGDATAGIWLGAAHVNLAHNTYLLGELDAALEAYGAAAKLGRTINDTRLQSLAGYSSSMVYVAREEWDTALARCREAADISRDPFTTEAATAIMGFVRLAMGQPTQACSLLRQPIESFERFGAPHIAGRFMAWRAEAYLAVGDTVSARKLADQALALASEAGARWPIGLAHRVLASLALAEADLVSAEGRLNDALAVFETMPAPLERAQTHLIGAELAHQRNDDEACAHHLVEAHRLYQARALPKRQARVEEVARALGVALAATPAG